MKIKCVLCGLILEHNQENFAAYKRKDKSIYISSKCRSCRNKRQRENRYKKIDRYRAQAKKRRDSKEYAEGRFRDLGYFGWTHRTEDKIRISCSWILGLKDFSNIWEKKFKGFDTMIRSSIIRRKNNPNTKYKKYNQKFINLNTVKKRIKGDYLNLSKEEKSRIIAELYLINSVAISKTLRALSKRNLWEKKIDRVLFQLWQRTN